VVSERRQRGGAEEADDGSEAWSEAIDHCSLFFLVLILSRFFLLCANRGSSRSESSPLAAHIWRQREFAIEAICRMHPGNLWVFVARAKEASWTEQQVQDVEPIT
jgi:hypothetical protein